MKKRFKRLLASILIISFFVGFSNEAFAKHYNSYEEFIADLPQATYTYVNVTVRVNWDRSWELLELTNKERREAGVQELKMDRRLVKAAIYRLAESMLVPGHLAAESTSLADLPKRLEYVNEGNPFTEIRENQNYGIGAYVYTPELQIFDSAKSTYEAYKNSQGHHNNYMREDWNTCGMLIGIDLYGNIDNPQLFGSLPSNKSVQEMPRKYGTESFTIPVKVFSNYWDYNVCTAVETFIPQIGYTRARKIGAKETIYLGESTTIGDWVAPVDHWYDNAYNALVGAGNSFTYYDKTSNRYEIDSMHSFAEGCIEGSDYPGAMSYCPPFDWNNLTFTSSDNSILSIDENGKCEAKALGTVRVDTSYKNMPNLKHSYTISVVPTPVPDDTFIQEEETGYWIFSGHPTKGKYVPHEEAGYYRRVDIENDELHYKDYLKSGSTYNKYEYVNDGGSPWMRWVYPPATPSPTPTVRPTKEPTPSPIPQGAKMYDESTQTYYEYGNSYFNGIRWKYDELTKAYKDTIKGEYYYYDDSKRRFVLMDPQPFVTTKEPVATEVPKPSVSSVPTVTSVPTSAPWKYIDLTNGAIKFVGKAKLQEKTTLSGAFRKNDVVKKYNNKKKKWEKVKKIKKKVKKISFNKTDKYKVFRKAKPVKIKTKYTAYIYPKYDELYADTSIRMIFKNKKKGTKIKIWDKEYNDFITTCTLKKNYQTIVVYGDYKKKCE